MKRRDFSAQLLGTGLGMGAGMGLGAAGMWLHLLPWRKAGRSRARTTFA